MSKNHQTSFHTPVLLQETLHYLNPQSGESYLDLTAGFGGHAAAVLSKTEAPAQAILVDCDQQAIKALKEQFAKQGVQIIHSDYLAASQTLKGQGKTFDLILADLGVSSLHLDRPERGFAFSHSGPLDMRMDTSQETSAASLVNEWDEAELAEVIRRYGEEPKAAKIAHAIVVSRPITTTDELAKVVAGSIGRQSGWRKIHPATKTFQAIRIAVNDELNQLSASLPFWVDLLAPGGRLAVISFHSLEDRIVKQFFAEHAGKYYGAELKPLTKKPATGQQHEIVSNPRARSARLRAVEKIKIYPPNPPAGG